MGFFPREKTAGPPLLADSFIAGYARRAPVASCSDAAAQRRPPRSQIERGLRS